LAGAVKADELPAKMIVDWVRFYKVMTLLRVKEKKAIKITLSK
jgi:hypothetical protein